jgi:hypothetical protein
MSRRNFTQGPFTVDAIGWDPGLAIPPCNSAPIARNPWLWLGTIYGEFPDPEPLIAKLRETYNPVPADPAHQIYSYDGARR